MSRNNRIALRLSDEEYVKLKIAANSLNLNSSKYLRFLALLSLYLNHEEQHELVKTSRLLLDTETYKQFLFQLQAIGNNLNQSTKALNALRLMPNVQIEDSRFADIQTSIKDTKELLQKTQTQMKNLENKTIVIK